MNHLAAAFVISLGLVPQALASATISYRGERLSVELDRAPAEAAIRDLERVAGVTVKAPASIARKTVTLSFSDLAVEDGVRQVLRALDLTSYAVIYGERKTFVVVESEPTATIPPAVMAPDAPPRPPQPVEHHDEVPAGSLLSRVVRKLAEDRPVGVVEDDLASAEISP